MEDKTLVRFDWAMKRLLRDKANFGVLEGFLTTLLNRQIKIDKILESESNKEFETQKYNRVDILAESTEGEKMLIEVQSQSEIEYFHRILFGTSRLISEYTRLGESYGKISKIFSINIVYFNLGEGTDSVYVGQTAFRGLHDNDLLRLPSYWKKKLKVEEVSDIFPVYYILRVNDFDRWSRTPLDQWLYFLSKGAVKDNADAPGMDMVQKRLRYDSLSRDEQLAYRKKLDDQLSIRNSYEQAKEQAREEGREEGLEEGRAEGLEAGRAEGLEAGRAEGLEAGRAEGLEAARAEGLEAGRAEGLEAGRAEGLEAGRAEGLEAGRAEGLEAGRAEGLEAGRAEGLEAGMRKEKYAIAISLKALGMSVDTIAKATGLSSSEIEALP